jgi:ribosomal protein S18 acetylase RimI-like enzyme
MIRNIIPEDHNFITQLSRTFNRFGPYEEIFMSILNGIAPLGVIGQVNLYVLLNKARQQTGFLAFEKQQNAGNILGVAVDENFRRQGIATLLLKHAEEIARSQEISTLECITAETENPSALKCFVRYGFINMGYAGIYPKRQPAVRLRLELAKTPAQITSN